MRIEESLVDVRLRVSPHVRCNLLPCGSTNLQLTSQ